MEYRSFKGSKEFWTLIIAGALIIGLIIIFNLISFRDYVPSSSAPAAPPTPRIGESVNVGAFAVTIHSIKESDPNSNGEKKVSIEISAINNAKKSESFLSSQVKLRDTLGREYEAESSGFGGVTINPGITEKGTVAYRVPESAEINSALLRDEMFDMGGADYVRVDLTK